MAEQEYIRLARPRLRSGFQAFSATRSGLWLGKDHLLCVETNGYTENYKRFYFRDIQAISLHRTRSFMVANMILTPLTILFVALGLSTRDEVDRIVLLCIAAFPLVPLIVNWVRGPSCVCRLRTAVQEEGIPALANLRKAQSVLQRVRPRIEEAQGALSREEIPARMQEFMVQSRPRLVVDDPNLPPRMVG